MPYEVKLVRYKVKRDGTHLTCPYKPIVVSGTIEDAIRAGQLMVRRLRRFEPSAVYYYRVTPMLTAFSGQSDVTRGNW